MLKCPNKYKNTYNDTYYIMHFKYMGNIVILRWGDVPR